MDGSFFAFRQILNRILSGSDRPQDDRKAAEPRRLDQRRDDPASQEAGAGDGWARIEF